MNTIGSVFLAIISICSALYAQDGIEAHIDDADGYTNIREQPNVESKIVGRIFESELFVCFPDSESNWWRSIKDSAHSRVEGYVYKSRIKDMRDVTDEIRQFFARFSKVDPNNAEYGATHNEDMFEFAQKFPLGFINALSLSDHKIQEFILNELKSPIHDLIDLKLIFTRIRESKGNDEIKSPILNSLKIAGEKVGSKLD
jgi:hypothetical protein